MSLFPESGLLPLNWSTPAPNAVTCWAPFRVTGSA
jgi:hypothetical protein